MASSRGGFVSSSNSTSSSLAGGATFTGAWEDVSGYSSVTVSLAGEGEGSLKLEHSSNASDADKTDELEYPIGGTEISAAVTARYARVVFENTGVDAFAPRLQTTYHVYKPALSGGSVTLAGMSNDQTRIAVSLHDGNGEPLNGTPGGELAVSLPWSFTSTDNSTLDPVASMGTYTGTAEDVLGYSSATIWLQTDTETLGAQVLFSNDPAEGFQEKYNISAYGNLTPDVNGGGNFVGSFDVPIVARYMKVQISNFSGSEASLNLTTILHRIKQSPEARIHASSGSAILANASGALVVVPNEVFNPVYFRNVGTTALNATELIDMENQRVSLISAVASNRNPSEEVFLKFYVSDTTPNPATSTPTVVVPIPAQTTLTLGLKLNANPILWLRAVKGLDDTDTTSPGTDEVLATLSFLAREI